MISPPDVDALPRTPRPILPRVVRVTRPVPDLTRCDLVASTSGITFDVCALLGVMEGLQLHRKPLPFG